MFAAASCGSDNDRATGQPVNAVSASSSTSLSSSTSTSSFEGTVTNSAVASLPEPAAALDTVEKSEAPDDDATTTTQFASGPVHEWVRRNGEVFELNAIVGNLLGGLDGGELDQLLGASEACAELSAVLAERSSLDAVIGDQEQRFADVAATCASIAASLASGDAAKLAADHDTLAFEYESLAEIFNACDELMYIGDANEPTDTGPSS